MPLASFEQPKRTDKIYIEVEARIFDGRTHACHRCKIHHRTKVMLAENLFKQWLVADVSFDEHKIVCIGRFGANLVDVFEFACGVIIIIEVVEGR